MDDQTVTAVFSRATEGEVGSFYYPLGMIAFTLSDPAKVALEQIRNNRPIRAQDYAHDELVRIAYEVTSLFHEMRHYFDAFGTVADAVSSRAACLYEAAVRALEQAFEIAFSNAELEALKTVGDLHDLVLRKISRSMTRVSVPVRWHSTGCAGPLPPIVPICGSRQQRR